MRLKFLSESMRRDFPPRGSLSGGCGWRRQAVGQEHKIGEDQNTGSGVRSM